LIIGGQRIAARNLKGVEPFEVTSNSLAQKMKIVAAAFSRSRNGLMTQPVDSLDFFENRRHLLIRFRNKRSQKILRKKMLRSKLQFSDSNTSILKKLLDVRQYFFVSEKNVTLSVWLAPRLVCLPIKMKQTGRVENREFAHFYCEHCEKQGPLRSG
jgi:hypothetical protein